MKRIEDILNAQDQQFLQIVEAMKHVSFGRMMTLISERWKRDCPTGAFAVGTCYGMLPRPEVQRFAEEMESTLKSNDHKGGWESCSPTYLIDRLKEEIEELEYALAAWYESGGKEGAEEVIKESTDVANFVMMMADKARQSMNTD